jgi:hypothetical protein
VHQTRTPIAGRTRRAIATTTPERTLVDLAGSLRAEKPEIAFESARRERLRNEPDQVVSELRGSFRRQASRREGVRRSIEPCDPRATG